MAMPKLVIPVGRALEQRIKQRAKTEGKSVAELLRPMLEREFPAQAQQPDQPRQPTQSG